MVKNALEKRKTARISPGKMIKEEHNNMRGETPIVTIKQ